MTQGARVMVKHIGKYRILERIGRGGMGSVYKAHDPVLDRLVAIKVVSAETDNTDELRVRFFREGQACAKLSHPNVVTIHDLGEADGNLFIVMELLEGDELRQLIVKRTIVHLEDKFPLMVQICDGLEYAHDKGIVHRDIKPGNIFVLRNGQVKILDFGIAHIAAAEAGLTRAGLIVGTLQYMAPERARGQGDRHADIFSVGAVFYELLTNRLPFLGDDPIEILEKLRTQNPPRLEDVDPALPPELGAIVERALEKDPARRFSTLGQMRTELQLVRRRLADDAERLRRDLRAQLRELHKRREVLETRLGGPWAGETVLVVDERAPLATLRSVSRDITKRIERLDELLARAESIRAALDSGLEALRTGDYERAVAELDRVVGEMPEHAHAVASLRQAQHHIAERHEQLVALVRQASAAYDAGEYARCLETLRSVAENGWSAAVPAEAEGLRHAAEAAIAREQEEELSRLEARRRASESAMRMRERAEDTRRAAEAADVRWRQAPLWNLAATRLAEAQAALAEEAYAPAEKHFEAARQLYERAAAVAREEQRAAAVAREERRAAARPAQEPVPQAPPPGHSVHDTVSLDAPAVLVETPITAPAEPPAKVPARAAPVSVEAEPPFVAATARKEDSARREPFTVQPRESGRPRPSGRARRYLVPSLAVLVLAACGLYYASSVSSRRESEEHSQREAVEQLRGTALAARDQAIKADARVLAPELFAKAQAAQAQGERLSGGRDLAAATKAHQEAADLYGEAERQARVKGEQRAAADAARAQMAAAKQRGSTDAADYAQALETERQGSSQYAQMSFTEAATSFRAATELFARAGGALEPPRIPSPPIPPNPRAEVRALLDNWIRAAETKDIELYRRVCPACPDIRDSFAIKRSHKVDLRVDEITISGDEAQALGRREDVIILKDGQRVHNEHKFVYTLKQGPRGWVMIKEIREYANRPPVAPRTPDLPAPRP
jgi:serine/threonine protein kinase